MNEAGFRSWLEADYSPNTVATKLSEARQLAKAYGDLDKLYDKDRLEAVMQSLRYSADDKAHDRPNPSRVPLTSDLYRDLSNLRTTVNYYRRYRGEKGQPRPDADAVNKAMDECAALGLSVFLDTYGFGKDIDYWALRKGERYPSKAVFGVAHQFMPGGAPLDGKSCNGTDARLHLEKVGFKIVKGDTAGASGPPITLFDAAGAAYVPEMQRSQSTGVIAYWVKPPEARSNRADEMKSVDTDLGIVRAILEDRLPARIKPVAGGSANLIKYGAGLLVSYSLRPDIAKALGLATSHVHGDAEMESEQQEPVNLILYGPPGTGKTYATAAEAVRLCGEEVPDEREDLMALYRSLHQKGRIGFVTFHQNFSYEDFVEGLRPVTSAQEEGGSASPSFSLQPQDGIFKLIADLAASNRGKAAAGGPVIDRSRKIFKMSLGRSWASEDDAIYQDAIRGGYVVLGWGGEVDWSEPRYDSWEAIKERWRQDHPDATGNDPNMSQMYAFRINMQVGSLVVISDGNRKFRAIGEIIGPYQFVAGPNGEYNHCRAVRWLWHSDESLPRELIYGKELSQVSVYQMNGRYVNWEGLEQIVAGGNATTATGAPEAFVLIIDEINRANISKVFGELITLLEPDKRLGMSNALTVRLPYSKQEFGVPANLHVLGTMNTADRSIALLDTALRRRFVFREMAPEPWRLPELVDGIPLRRVLETINDRIEYLIDREHRIGHAFFMGDGGRDRQAIDGTMRDKIIPLLQEYFFEDWGRVAAVLGDRGTGGGFLDCRKLKDPTGQDGEMRQSWNVRSTFSPDAYDRLIGKTSAQSLAPSLDDSLEEAAE